MDDHTITKIAIRDCHIRLMRGGAGPWARYMGALADKFDVIVPEHPGFGDSDSSTARLVRRSSIPGF